MVHFSDLTPIRQFYLIIVMVASILAIIIVINMLVIYEKKKTVIKQILAIMIIILTLAILLDPVFFWIYMIWDVDLIDLQTNLSLGLTGIANCFLILFIRNVFYNAKLSVISRIIMIVEILVFPILIGNFIWIQSEIIELITLGTHLLISFYVFISLFLHSTKLRRQILINSPEDAVASSGLRYIGASGILLFLTFLAFVLQEVASAFYDVFSQLGLIDVSESSIFIPIGFLLAAISTICLFLGYFTPEWIQKRWKSKKTS